MTLTEIGTPINDLSEAWGRAMESGGELQVVDTSLEAVHESAGLVATADSFACPFCSAYFERGDDLTSHLVAQHSEEFQRMLGGMTALGSAYIKLLEEVPLARYATVAGAAALLGMWIASRRQAQQTSARRLDEICSARFDSRPPTGDKWFARFVFVPMPALAIRPEILSAPTPKRWDEITKDMPDARFGTGMPMPFSDGIRCEGMEGNGWIGADSSVGAEVWLPGRRIVIQGAIGRLSQRLDLITMVNPGAPGGVIRFQIGGIGEREIQSDPNGGIDVESAERRPATSWRSFSVKSSDKITLAAVIKEFERGFLRDAGIDAP